MTPEKTLAVAQNYHPATIGLPTLYLGYGLQDNFAAANEFLAQLLLPQSFWETEKLRILYSIILPVVAMISATPK
jgi:hypothetical protein